MDNEINYDNTVEINEYLWRIGVLKDHSIISMTWGEIGKILNETFYENKDEYKSDSYWRKTYKKLKDSGYKDENEVSFEDPLITFSDGIEQKKVIARDERNAKARMVRSSARENNLLAILEDEIKRFEPIEFKEEKIVSYKNNNAVYALLSDIHYGMSFDSIGGKYNPEIAKSRLNDYANEIIRIGRETNAHECYISMLGDLISGLIHNTIRIENTENVIKQTIEISEYIAEFIHHVAKSYDKVYVNSVCGNHSRMSLKEDALNGERLDAIIPWYCKTKLENAHNVFFIDAFDDCTINGFRINGKNYIAVHGDFDKLKTNVIDFVTRITNEKVDTVVMGHGHVSKTEIGRTNIIENGCVSGSGDEFCIKNRLYGIPSQICMVVSERGIESIHPVEFNPKGY